MEILPLVFAYLPSKTFGVPDVDDLTTPDWYGYQVWDGYIYPIQQVEVVVIVLVQRLDGPRMGGMVALAPAVFAAVSGSPIRNCKAAAQGVGAAADRPGSHW